MNSKIVSICGPSGVGKTTVSRLVSIILGHEDCVIVSGDDSHKWERGDENWKFYTHLDPIANNLEKEYLYIEKLKNGENINRSTYNHKNGKFNKKTVIIPKKYIIYEGLHTMYGNLSDLSDISIYINVESSIKNRWKIKRDSAKRGYPIYKIVKDIDRRKDDELKYIVPQKNKCDIIINVFEEGNNINMSFDYSDKKYADFINSFKEIYKKHCDFILISKKLSENIYLAQNKGGNMSFKFNDLMAITDSGSSFSDVSFSGGFNYYDKNNHQVFKELSVPSMEISCHKKLGNACIHTHPLNLLAILCSKECEQILSEIYEDYLYIDSKIPGKSLSQKIKNKNIIFVKNHGLFVSYETLEECYEKTIDIENSARKYLNNTKKYLFPDSIVLEKENEIYHSFVLSKINDSGLTPDFLSEEDVKYILSMEEEKYRREKK